MRKKVKASNTQLAMNTIGAEMAKAVSGGLTVDYCLSIAESSAWKGFKADWVLSRQQGFINQSKHDLSNMKYESGDL